MRYYIIAGEASGDLHGSNLMKGLYALDSEAEIRFWGGSMMNAVAAENRPGQDALVKDYKEGAVMGITQVILKAGTLLRNIRSCKEDILSWAPDAVILIDYPGFNLKIAEFAHKKGFKVFWYIAPKVWASREGRIRKIKKYVDKLFIVFPFEKKYFDSKGISYVYAGNPLIDAIDGDKPSEREAFLSGNNLPDKPYIAMLAGSRKGEVSGMMPVFEEFARKLKAIDAYRDYQFIVAGAPSRSPEDYSKWTRSGLLKVVFGETRDIVRHAQAAVVNSGTASLETALIGTPQVVVYKTSSFNFAIAQLILKIEVISLGNLIAGHKVFKELIQDYCTADTVMNEVLRLTSDAQYRQKMLDGYALIREKLGGSGASEAVARTMIAELS